MSDGVAWPGQSTAFLSIGCGTPNSESVKRLGVVNKFGTGTGSGSYRWEGITTAPQENDEMRLWTSAWLSWTWSWKNRHSSIFIVDESRKKGRGRTVPQNRVM